ncbi:MAG TPA: methylamine dehydrogenase light chain [Steroidobacteraceae bacterium]
MKPYDSMIERASRRLAKTVSRRSVLRTLGTLLVGAASVPLLPVARGQGGVKDKGDPGTCDYWRHCAIDGFLCACCGGSVTTCPPGTEPAPITWVGTCRNAADGRDYIVSYNDCCGKSSCGRCLCNRNEGDGPLYRPPVSNDYNWCVGSNSNIPYHCTVSRIVGVADKTG